MSPPTQSDDADAQQQQRYHEQVTDTEWKLSLRSIPELKRANSRAELATIGLLHAADLDDRPTFAVDVSSDVSHEGPLEFVYTNPALEALPRLLARVKGDNSPAASMFADGHEPHVAFKAWLWGEPKDADADYANARSRNGYQFGHHLWYITRIERHGIVSGVPIRSILSDRTRRSHRSAAIDPREIQSPRYPPQYDPNHPPSLAWEQQQHPSESMTPGVYGPFDYTLDPPPERLSTHIRYFRNIDWEKTDLGPMENWCPQLRCVVNMVMNDSHPAVLFWGDQVTMIYNEAYVELISLMHPCMGQSARVAAKEYWPHFQPIVDYVNATGETVNHELPLFLDRHGFLEETYFSFQFVPIMNTAGHIAGYYQPLLETTKNGLLERRVSSLVEIGSQTAKARDLKAFFDLVRTTLTTNGKDVPFALFYAAEFSSAPSSSCISSPGSKSNEVDKFVLNGGIGVESGHAIAPSSIDIRIESSTVFHSYLLKAIKTRKPIVVHFKELQIPEGMLDGIDWKGYGDPCRSVVVCPVLPTTGEQIQGFIILGINPRRPFDEDYQQFVHVMLRLLATSLASVLLFEDEIRQKENAIGQAARIQEQLLAKLQLKEKKFQRFAERSDVAIFIMDAVGKYTYRNQSWYKLFESAADQDDAMNAWTKIVFSEDIERCESIFTRLIVEKIPVCFELKTLMPWVPPPKLGEPEHEGKVHNKWVLCSAYPDLDAKGEIVEIVGNVTDISKLKWAEDVQRQGKRHLEHFIDTTSHEMRNPLSAIMQCADAILTSYPQVDNEFPVPSPISYASSLDQIMDAAQTIAQCAQHMKRIVDDILTISKLDSGLLIITPIDAQPESVVCHAIKMFESEAKAANVEMCLRIEQSFRELAVDWVSLDPTRLLQILINLITNALKFTRLESTRHVTVTISASEEKPVSVKGIQFEEKLVEDDRNLADDWKRGSTVYLQFSVEDTGRGLTDSERSSLFARFSQASPRTHINYGGSGLGLFISRRLTEMQGGAIGLSSEYKKGSTFSFYIKARKTASARMRRQSTPDVFPEDIRHRATTRKEIIQLHKTPQSPAPDKFSPQPRASHKITAKTVQLLPPPLQKLGAVKLDVQSTLNSNVLAEATGLSRDPNLYELKRKQSIPDILHVLVVEDNLVNQKVLAQQLQKLGCIVSVANHGVEALEFLKKTKYWAENKIHHSPGNDNGNGITESSPKSDLPVNLSVILMDWEMPVMNGLLCTRHIRNMEREGKLTATCRGGGRLPVIGVTANVRQQQIQEAMEAGMDDVVSKPFRVPELMERMKGIVEGMRFGKSAAEATERGGEMPTMWEDGK